MPDGCAATSVLSAGHEYVVADPTLPGAQSTLQLSPAETLSHADTSNVAAKLRAEHDVMGGQDGHDDTGCGSVVVFCS